MHLNSPDVTKGYYVAWLREGPLHTTNNYQCGSWHRTRLNQKTPKNEDCRLIPNKSGKWNLNHQQLLTWDLGTKPRAGGFHSNWGIVDSTNAGDLCFSWKPASSSWPALDWKASSTGSLTQRGWSSKLRGTYPWPSEMVRRTELKGFIEVHTYTSHCPWAIRSLWSHQCHQIC